MGDERASAMRPEVGQYVLHWEHPISEHLNLARVDRVTPKTVFERLAYRERRIPIERVLACFDDFDRASDVTQAVREAYREDGPFEAKSVLDRMMAETDTVPGPR